jgi:hypothetical protein
MTVSTNDTQPPTDPSGFGDGDRNRPACHVLRRNYAETRLFLAAKSRAALWAESGLRPNESKTRARAKCGAGMGSLPATVATGPCNGMVGGAIATNPNKSICTHELFPTSASAKP